MAGYKYDWKCPSCGTKLQLKMRVTQTKRRCPHCGLPVTPDEIDRQGVLKGIGSMIVFLVLATVCGYPQCQTKRIAEPDPITISTPMPSAPKVVTEESASPHQIRTPSSIKIDLSTPQKAFESYLSARWGDGKDIELYLQTLSKKRIREELASPVLSTDVDGKKRTLKEIVAYQFRLDSQPEPCCDDYRLSKGYSYLGDPQIRGNSATVWYHNSGAWRVCRLTKEGSQWKVDSHYEFPKKQEEEEFFRNKRKQESAKRAVN